MLTKDHAYSHAENRRRICVLCQGKKSSMKVIGASMKNLIQKFLSYNLEDDRLPAAICSACRIGVYRLSKGEKSVKLQFPDYSKYTYPPPEKLSSREAGICPCTLCCLARKNGRETWNRKKKFAPVSKKKLNTNKNCSKCSMTIAKGRRHNCQTSRRYRNIKQIADSKLSFTQKEQMVCSYIKDSLGTKAVARKKHESKEILLPQRRGKRLRVSVGQLKTKEVRQISSSDVSQVQTRFGLSSKKVNGISTAFRVASRNRRMFEPNLMTKLDVSNHKLDEFFEVREDVFTRCVGKNTAIEKKKFVICKDIEGLFSHIQQLRGTKKVHKKIGLDGGGGFMKICASLQSLDEDCTTLAQPSRKRKRQTYEEGIAAQDFRDSGVKKLLILAVVENAQENSENVRKLWKSLKLDELDFTIATDLKLANILAGLMSHSSTCPCCWCDVEKDNLSRCGNYRTWEDCEDQFKKWQKSGSNKKQAKKFKNCVNEPIIQKKDGSEIIETIPPPQLHVMIGVFNHIYKHLLKTISPRTQILSRDNHKNLFAYFGKFIAIICNDLPLPTRRSIPGSSWPSSRPWNLFCQFCTVRA
ncbi:hypothetical protein QAD02_021373 [Eretmocerus hayati]|uniref:Uncharacterized protein n=1 Tax=Eretmocerus hayati TaxID=131215 RepID=A0ACC2PQ92_9HYME|nr:hypothetical protein QAD02_021373 [Eretmocerus hayati]